MVAYYNEHDRHAAQWIRNLVGAGLVAPGIVDERSIEDVTPGDLRGFTQCHFFAGIAVWSAALRLARWADERPVWTGSCPCQPFSQAGKGGGTADERHLWPAWYDLIRRAKPRAVPVFGEQVASKDGRAWFATVRADLEGASHAVGGGDLCAAGFGAPHIRQRLYFVAHPHEQLGGQGGALDRGGYSGGDAPARPGPGGGGVLDGVGNSQGVGRSGFSLPLATGGSPSGIAQASGVAHSHGQRLGTDAGGELHHAEHYTEPRSSLGDPDGAGRRGGGRAPANLPDEPGNRPLFGDNAGRELPNSRRSGLEGGHAGEVGHQQPAAKRASQASFWSRCEWVACSDGKARPVEPGTSPLVNGAVGRVVKLRAYGNAIVAPQAAEFVAAYISAVDE